MQDRLTISPEVYPNLSIAVSTIYRDGGLGAFYAGISPTLVGMLPYSTSYYFMYETVKNAYCLKKKKKSLNRIEMLLVGALSGESFDLNGEIAVSISLQIIHERACDLILFLKIEIFCFYFNCYSPIN